MIGAGMDGGSELPQVSSFVLVQGLQNSPCLCFGAEALWPSAPCIDYEVQYLGSYCRRRRWASSLSFMNQKHILP